jgi:hypothetical protein
LLAAAANRLNDQEIVWRLSLSGQPVFAADFTDSSFDDASNLRALLVGFFFGPTLIVS